MSKSIIDRKVITIEGIEFPVSTDINEMWEDILTVGSTVMEIPKTDTLVKGILA